MHQQVIKEALQNIDIFTQRIDSIEDLKIHCMYVSENNQKVINEWKPLTEFADVVNKNPAFAERLLTSFYNEIVHAFLPSLKSEAEKLRIQMTQLESVLKEKPKNKPIEPPKFSKKDSKDELPPLPESFITETQKTDENATDEPESLG